MSKLYSIRTREITYRIIIVSLIVAMVGVGIYAMYLMNLTTRESKENIYVLEDDYVLRATLKRKYGIDVEYSVKAHINRFHELLWNLNPDAQQINETLSKAMNLSDNSAYVVYDRLKQEDFYTNLIAQGYSCILQTDSIATDFSITPVRFAFYGRLRITRNKTFLYRNMITEGTLRKITPTPDNDRGYFIENFKIVNDEDISVVDRYSAN